MPLHPRYLDSLGPDERRSVKTAVRARRRVLSRPSRSHCRGHDHQDEIFGAAGGFRPTARGRSQMTEALGPVQNMPPEDQRRWVL